jgi:hypothetical protein
MGYFEKQESYKGFIKILVGIIAGLVVLNLLIVKSLINVASNKTIQIQVPQFMESGEYVIGNTFANENVFKMWTKVWVQDIATFSYKDLGDRYKSIYPFLDSETGFKSKSEMLKFIQFVESNYITQTFTLKDIKVDKMENGYMKMTAYGTIKRMIGNETDSLSGMRYSYEFITYVRNGQVYINSISSKFEGLVDVREKEKLKENKFVNFEEVIQ